MRAIVLLALAFLAFNGMAGDMPLPFFRPADEWMIFLNVEQPESFAKVPDALKDQGGREVRPLTAKMKDAAIDLATLSGSPKGEAKSKTAILYNEFTADSDGLVRTGLSADYWMEAYVNGKLICSTTKDGNGYASYSPDDHIVEFPVKAGKNVVAVKVLCASAGWKFVCGTPKPTLKFEANGEWKPVDMSDIQVKAGSALDQSSLAEMPKQGPGATLPRLIIGKEGRLVAENSPDRPVRLRGMNGQPRWYPALPDEEWRPAIAEFSGLAKRQGYNCLRLWVEEINAESEDMSLDLGRLEKFDYMFNQFKTHGIYVHLELGIFQSRRPKEFAEVLDVRVRLYLGDQTLREAWKYGAVSLMNHVNPYTGLAWKDDPLFACVEFFNEMEGGLMWSDFLPETRAKFSERFRTWLESKYKTPDRLAAAWGRPELKAFEQVEVPQRLRQGKGQEHKDFVLLCNELSRECGTWFDTTLREAGYKGLVSQYDCPAWMGDIEARYEESQIAVNHSYYSHPSKFSKPGSKCSQKSSVGETASYWRSANATRFADRPFSVTEYNHAFWNQYQRECGLLFGAYSALQGFDALIIHTAPVKLKAGYIDDFSVGNNPVSRAGEFLSGCLFLRGDVRQAPHRVELDIPQSAMDEFKTVSTEQSKISLMTGFSVAFPWARRPCGVANPAPEPDVRIASSTGADTVSSTGWSVEVVNTKDSKFSTEDFASLMKGRGILPKDNLSDPANEIFQSETGEITLRAKEKLLKVVTKRAEAVSMEGGKAETVGLLSIAESSVGALVAACAVDEKALADSRRIVLIYSTEVVNTGMELSADRMTLVKLGRAPVLMRTGKLEMTLKNSNGAKMSFHALGLDGARREKLPLSISGGTIKISLDTASLKNGPTPFFELVAE